MSDGEDGRESNKVGAKRRGTTVHTQEEEEDDDIRSTMSS
jgi:hypothetical protein